MNKIILLDKETIDKIAAGEVVERPSSVVKELLENAIDSGALSVSVEIQNGGIDLIRVTDNGSGIAKDELSKAVMRHATSKIRDAKDLGGIRTLGFRGEALSSISAVSRLEILTKSADSPSGAILKLEGGNELSLEDAGLPSGTTVIVRNLFYNVPARLKFLKSAKTEAGHVADTVEKIALSHPEISFKFTSGGSLRLITTGNGSLKEAVYCVFGREIYSNLLYVDSKDDLLEIQGYIGKPEVSRSTRALENFFVNGRFVKDKVVSKALEDAYSGYQMKGSFPFACFNILIDPALVDVNVHPAKLEIKFSNAQEVYESIYSQIRAVIWGRENIPSFTIEAKNPAGNTKGEDKEALKEPGLSSGAKKDEKPYAARTNISMPEPFETSRIASQQVFSDIEREFKANGSSVYEQASLSDERFMGRKAAKDIKIIGQVFDTYWICEFDKKMYIIDQHAAHEKVLYEKFMAQIEKESMPRQMIAPPVIVSLSAAQELTFEKYSEYFKKAGFEAEHFGASEYALIAVPASLYTSINAERLFLDSLDELSSLSPTGKPEILLDRVATAACKAAVKGNSAMSFKEAKELIESLMDLENPYNCPHGRPTMIVMSKYEMEKKFKRII